MEVRIEKPFDRKFCELTCFVKSGYGWKNSKTQPHSDFAVYDFNTNRMITRHIRWQPGSQLAECELLALRALLNYLDTVHLPFDQRIHLVLDSKFTIDKLRDPNAVSLVPNHAVIAKECIGILKKIIATLRCKVVIQHGTPYDIGCCISSDLYPSRYNR